MNLIKTGVITNTLMNNFHQGVLGIVEGEIHFIGKDIFKTLVQVNGFAVRDLCVDISSFFNMNITAGSS
jgi:methanogenic corrinoid protein MtbC1